MIKVNRWKPDTCDCIIDYEWDDAVPDASRVHTLRQLVHRGLEHSFGTDAQIYADVQDENTRKNVFLSIVLENIPRLTEIDPDSGAVQLKSIHEYVWSFDASRNLIASIVGSQASERASLRGLADGRFGPGKVIVQ